MNQKVAAFTCTHSPNLPELLHQLNCTIALSTYQAGKVVLISAVNHTRLIQLPRTFAKPMGIAVNASRLAIATLTEVIVFNNAGRMAPNYPQQPNTYDALFLPRATYFTGEVDIHDLHWIGETLLAVNTRFSCLATIDHHFSFTPQWKPFFISKITPEDHCHLNGVAFEKDKPKYVTALGQTDVPEGWRQNKDKGGVVMEVSSNSIIAEGLSMPHSPRIYNNKLYVLESASGNLVCIDPSNGKKEIVVALNGFARGMDKVGDFVFIGLSQLRKKSVAFNDLPIAKKSVFCGIVVVHLPTAKVVAHLKYENSVEEIYDVRIMPGMRRPGLLSTQKLEHRLALTTPHEDYWAVIKQEPKDDQIGNINKAYGGAFGRIHNLTENKMNKPLPVLTISDILGIPVTDCQYLIQLGVAMTKTLDLYVSMKDLVLMNKAATDFIRFFQKQIKIKYDNPDEGLLSKMVQKNRTENLGLSDEELISIGIFLFTAGEETSASLISNALLNLLKHPDQLNRLRQKPDMIESAIEEVLRYDSIVQLLGRVAKEDFVIRDRVIPANATVTLVVGSANRDEQAFEQADQFIISRKPNRHLSFGSGVHYCLGDW